VAAQQVEEDMTNAGAQSMSHLPTADCFNDIVPDTSDDSYDEWGQ